MAAAAMCCFMFIISLGSYSLFFKSVSYISIDVNPSIELSLNRLNRVVKVKAYNSDGEKIAESADIDNMECGEAIKKILGEEKVKGYLENEPIVSVAVYSEDKKAEESLYSKVETVLKIAVPEQYESGDAEVISVDESVLNSAHEHGMTAGRYCEYSKIKETDPEFTAEECNNSSMRQLRRRCMGETGKNGEAEESETHEGEAGSSAQEHESHGQNGKEGNEDCDDKKDGHKWGKR